MQASSLVYEGRRAGSREWSTQTSLATIRTHYYLWPQGAFLAVIKSRYVLSSSYRTAVHVSLSVIIFSNISKSVTMPLHGFFAAHWTNPFFILSSKVSFSRPLVCVLLSSVVQGAVGESALWLKDGWGERLSIHLTAGSLFGSVLYCSTLVSLQVKTDIVASCSSVDACSQGTWPEATLTLFH